MSAPLFPLRGVHALIYLTFSVLVITGTYAVNDWNKPCISGMCQYDLDPSRSGSSGTLKIWGPATAISDITPAAGWRILGCDENMEFRLVCTSPLAHCSHLFSDAGPKDKIVRLPDWCGPNPFARVVEASISPDQSLPPKLAAKLWKRDGQVPPVHALRLDTDFHKIAGAGVVRFAIQAATIPMEHDIDTHVTIDERSSRLVTRRYDDIVSRSMDSIKEGIVNYGNTAGSENHVNNAIENVEDIGLDAEARIKKKAKKVVEAIKVDAQKVAKKAKKFFKSVPFGPIKLERNMTIAEATINCPPLVSLGFQVTLNPDIRVNGTIGVVVVGTLSPRFHIADYSTITKLSAEGTAVLGVYADVSVVWDTGRIPIFEIGLPGMDFPGILSIGPKFQIGVQSKLTLDFPIGARIGISFHVKDALIYYPQGPGRRSTVHSVGLRKLPLHLNATPFVQAFFQLEGKIITSVSIGVDALGALAPEQESALRVAARTESTLFWRVQLEEDGKTRTIKRREPAEIDSDTKDISIIRRTTNDNATRTIDQRDIQRSTPSKTLSVVKRSGASPALRRRGGLSPGPQPTAGGRGPPKGMDSTKGPAFRGCAEGGFQLEVYVGPETEVLGLELANSKYSLFKHAWPLWENCFGLPKSVRKSLRKLISLSRLFRRGLFSPFRPLRRLQCVSVSYSAAEALISDNSNVQLSVTRPLKAKL